jgi:hypothetical protein
LKPDETLKPNEILPLAFRYWNAMVRRALSHVESQHKGAAQRCSVFPIGSVQQPNKGFSSLLLARRGSTHPAGAGCPLGGKIFVVTGTEI